MTLGDIYSKNVKRWGHGATKFFMNPITKEPFNLLNQINPPSWAEIKNYQQSCAKEIHVSLKARRLVKILQKDQNFNPNSMMFDVEKHIKNIENALSWEDPVANVGGLTGLRSIAKKNGQLTANDIRNYLQRYPGLINDLTEAYKALSEQNFANQSSQVIVQFNKFEKALLDFLQVCKQLNTDSSNFIIDPESGFLQSLIWTGNVLKGALLETEGKDFFDSVLPKNIITINSGDIKGITFDIFGNKAGSGKSIVQDYLSFDANKLLGKNIIIKFTINGQAKSMPIMDFLEFINKRTSNETIQINEEDYNKLLNASITGTSAKSGAGNIRFKGNISPSQAVAAGSSAANYNYIFALKSLMRLVDKSGPYHSTRILSTDETKSHEYYDQLFAYAISKNLQKIIGVKNEIMLGRNGVQTIQEFLIDKLKDYVMKAYNAHINIRTNKPVTVGLQKV